MEESSHKKQIIAALAVLIVVAVIAGGATALSKKDANEDSNSNQTVSLNAGGTAHPTHSAYKDGTYTATGDYNSPGGSEEITVTVTLKDNVVTDTSAKNGANDIEAKQHQQDFIDNYKSQVVGKKLNAVSLSRVSGSSLTSQGFNDAIQQIRDQAGV